MMYFVKCFATAWLWGAVIIVALNMIFTFDLMAVAYFIATAFCVGGLHGVLWPR